MQSEHSVPCSKEPRWMQSTSNHSNSLKFALILYIHRCLGSPCGFILSGFRTKMLDVYFISTIRATCFAHVILDFIFLMAFSKECKLQDVRFCLDSWHFFHLSPYDRSSVSTLLPNTLNFLLMWDTKFHILIDKRVQIYFIYFDLYIFRCCRKERGSVWVWNLVSNIKRGT
jgi:hypothetical protein